MKIIQKLCVFIILFLIALPQISAQEAVYLIRHAEQGSDGWDPSLTEQGRDRARVWSRIFADSGISKVFVSEYERTQQTGEIIAESLGVSTQAVDRRSYGDLIKLLRTEHSKDSVLVVSHSGIIPQILWGYEYQEHVVIDKSVYDYLFVIIPKAETEPQVICLHCN